MSVKERGNSILKEARRLARQATSWADFSNALFDQREGLVAKVFPNMNERQAFYDSPEYNAVRRLLLDLMRKLGLADGAVPQKSGRFVVRVPKTIHTVLEVEAKREGVSLNQLAVAKLSVKLKDSAELTAGLIAEAFRQVHDGYSTDRIIVDPDYNARFLDRCRDLGLDQSDYFLNHMLYDIRKSKKAILPPAKKMTVFKDYDRYAFAAEIGVRVLQRSSGVSLDQVVCDPELRRQFDELAQRLSPEEPVLKLRWAALNLRKTHRLKPGDVHGPEYDLVSAGPVERVNLDEIPTFPGTYVFYDRARPLFADETHDIRGRLEVHLRHSGRRGLPTWLDIDSSNGFDLKYLALPSLKREERLSWLRQFINKEKPLLNYQKAA